MVAESLLKWCYSILDLCLPANLPEIRSEFYKGYFARLWQIGAEGRGSRQACSSLWVPENQAGESNPSLQIRLGEVGPHSTIA